jgi:hypothetical protein
MGQSAHCGLERNGRRGTGVGKAAARRIVGLTRLRFPKPAKRSPKPRKRVKRSVRPHAVRQTKRAAAKRDLAYLWRVKVRAKYDGRCSVARYASPEVAGCRGRITAAHCFGVDEAPAVRLAVWNGEPLCEYHHEWFERRKRSHWRVYLIHLWGGEGYTHRLSLARQTTRVDLDQAARELAG